MGSALTRTAGLVAGTALALTGCSGSAAPELAAFDRPATSEDALPDVIELREDFGETRYIAEVDGARVYAAPGPDDRPWCVAVLVGTVEDENWAVGSSCANDAEFAERGVWVAVRGPGPKGEATLLPDDFDGELRDGWEIAGPNLAVPTG